MNKLLRVTLVTSTMLSAAMFVNAVDTTDSHAQRIAAGEVSGSQDANGISLVSHAFNRVLGRHVRLGNQGDTIVGRIDNANANTSVEVTVGSTVLPAEVDADTGEFLVRIDSEFLQNPTVEIQVQRINGNNRGASATYVLGTDSDRRGIANVLSRITFGATPGLLAYFSEGNIPAKYREYVEEQLQPETVDDSHFENDIRKIRFTQQVVDGGTNNQAIWRVTADWRLQYSTYSERQLREVMTKFWDNHFFSYHAQTVRRDIAEIVNFRENAFGSFRDLLGISANSVVMMRYLNNSDNRRNQINENYARELLELHTVSSDGGYTDVDIRQVARVFSGWGHRHRTNRGSDFEYYPNRHDLTNKRISFLNLDINGRSGEAGKNEGEEVLDALAKAPATRRFVCSKLIKTFVADEVPNNILEACMDTWEETDGSMREVVRTILLHPEYLSNVSIQRNKLKTPYEYQVSMLRNFAIYPPIIDSDGARTSRFFRNTNGTIENAGHRWDGTPDGNPEEAEAWLSTGTMLANYNGFIGLIRPGINNGNLTANGNSDLDPLIFAENAQVKTAEGVAAHLLELATSDRYKSDELAAVAEALRGSDGIFEIEGNGNLDDDIRRAITLVATLPNAYIQ